MTRRKYEATELASQIDEHVETIRLTVAENEALHPADRKTITAALNAIEPLTESVRTKLFEIDEQIKDAVKDAVEDAVGDFDERIDDVRLAAEHVSAAADRVLGCNWLDESRERYELRRALRDLREVVRHKPKTDGDSLVARMAAPLWTHD